MLLLLLLLNYIVTGGKNGNQNPGGHANLQFYLTVKITGRFLWKNHSENLITSELYF